MSPDVGQQAGDATFRLRAGGDATFGRLVAVVIAVMAAVVAVLILVSAGRGPQLTGVQFDADAAVTRTGQRMLLQSDQALASIDDAAVDVEPEVPVSVQVDGTAIVVRFDAVLDYATTYRLTITGVTAARSGNSATFSHAFTTADMPVYTLVRASTGDQVIRHWLASGTSDVVFSASGIQQYVVTRSSIVAITGEPADQRLTVTTTAGQAWEAETGQVTTMRSLQRAAGTDLVGYLATPVGGQAADGEQAPALYVFDASDPATPPRAVLDGTGTPLAVMDWRFVPGASAVVVQDTEAQVYLVDLAANATPQPLGAHEQLRGFVPGTTTVIVTDGGTGSALDLQTGELSHLELPAILGADDGLYPGPSVVIGHDDYVQVYNEVASVDGGSLVSSVLYRSDASGARVLYRPDAQGTRIRDVCLAPNGRYVSIEVVAAGAAGDGRLLVPGFAGATTVVLRLDTGEPVLEADGFLSDWCVGA